MRALTCIFSGILFLTQLGYADYLETGEKIIEITGPGVQEVKISSAVFNGKMSCYEEWTESCESLNCHMEKEEVCSERTIEVCDAFRENCYTQTEKECWPEQREVCVAPNPCIIGPSFSEEVCTEVKGQTKKFSSEVAIQIDHSQLEILRNSLKLKITLDKKSTQIQASNLFPANQYIIIGKIEQKNIQENTKSRYLEEMAYTLNAVSLDSVRPKVVFKKKSSKGITIDKNFFGSSTLSSPSSSPSSSSSPSLHVLITNSKRKKIYVDKNLTSSELETLENGDLRLEFWRLGFKKKIFKSYVVRITAVVNPNVIINSLKAEFGVNSEILNEEILTRAPMSGYFEARF